MKTITVKKKNISAKPFLKWAGGKTQLLDELIKRLPASVKKTHIIDSYVEPFVGGGAMFFYLKNNYDIKKSFLFDINRELIVGYKVIQNNHRKLINRMEEIEKEYLNKTEEERKEYYYKI
jgi:DNA adenine methylase